jgi:hypothetical protein
VPNSRTSQLWNFTVAHAHLRAAYERSTKPQLEDIQRALRGAGVESTTGALDLKIDLNAATGTIVGSMAALGGHVTMAGAAIAVTVLPYVADKIKVSRKRVKNSPVAYLLAANRTLGGTSLLRSLTT